MFISVPPLRVRVTIALPVKMRRDRKSGKGVNTKKQAIPTLKTLTRNTGIANKKSWT